MSQNRVATHLPACTAVRYMTRIACLAALLCAPCLPQLVTPVRAQSPAASTAVRDSVVLDSLFRAQRYPVSLRDGRLEGPGAALLAEATRNAQFVVLAESHYVGEIPRFTTAWFDELHRRRGFDYYAIEYGPAIGRMLSRRPVRGDTAAVVRLGARYPHAFQFLNDEEL